MPNILCLEISYDWITISSVSRIYLIAYNHNSGYLEKLKLSRNASLTNLPSNHNKHLEAPIVFFCPIKF